ncbi:type I DNA topoisomerase [Psittacicella hinzii]|uniref:type I DNA topoisomerase n=1 Tax=Psittacicella hinzii TaxID=2028575 RepID=UPI0036219FA7
MAKSLVIVESPNKTATIKKYLSDDFIVLSSVGHIRDLPTNSEFAPIVKRGVKLSDEQKLNNKVLKMGINPVNWEGDFHIMEEKRKVVAELKATAKQCDTIYLATDLDREGESIAWHLQEVLGPGKTYKRVIFNEITQSAIKKAFAKPITLNMDRVHAQQTRRYLDRIVGFLLSPLLISKAGRGLSAGRVQSVATRLIVEREREIRKFMPTEYWSIFAFAGKFDFDLHSIDGKRLVSPADANPFYIPNQEQALQHLENIKNGNAVITSIDVKDSSSSPSAPFTTSTLQQRASSLLGYDVRTTMSLAQYLYEMGYITYMRTDSVNISAEARDMAEKYIKSEYGEQYWDGNRQYATNNANSQEAHEAIRPTNLNLVLPPASRGARLYNLIKQQFLASLMANAISQNTNINVGVENEHKYNLRFSASLLKFAGFKRAFGNQADKLVDVTGNLKVGDSVKFTSLDKQQNFTNPPSRYSEASLVKELEKRSIGRPSTYASIISTIQDRGYVTLENRRFFAEKIAEIVTDSLSVSFPEIMDYDFTAQMESSLDEIANGKKDWTSELDTFWAEFKQKLIAAAKPADQGGMPNKQLVPTDFLCPTCGKHHMALQFSKTGTFLTCMGYENKGEDKCHRSVTLVKGDEIIGEQKAEHEHEHQHLHDAKRCPKCQSVLDEFYIDTKHKLYICSNMPSCTFTQVEQGQFINNAQLDALPCDKCGEPMELKVGPFGKYMLCGACGNTRRVLASGEIAPPKQPAIEFPELKCQNGTSYFVLRNSAKGIFFGANNFPRCRETQLAKVEVLATYKDRLPEELHYLAQGPTEDNLGNKTVVRYAVKTKSQYIGSVDQESNKLTKFRADYEDGKWVVTAEASETSAKSTSKSSTKKAATKKKSTAKSTSKSSSVTASSKATKASTKAATKTAAKATAKTTKAATKATRAKATKSDTKTTTKAAKSSSKTTTKTTRKSKTEQ